MNKLNTNTQLLQTVVTGCFSTVAENVIVTTGSDFSGVGAFDQALERLGIKQNKKFACDMDKYARQTYIYNFGEPDYYPENVYEREIPKESLDIYMTSPPCQSFSLAGKRKGEDSKNGVLFYNSHDFIVKNNPRYFIFENVKGLLSDDNGKTFQRWIDYLGGKSANGNPVIFPHEESVPYHVYYQVLNAKHYGVPQNRERIFIIGIRDDKDNDFSFPKPFPLTKRLKDVLETEVDEKYFLSDTMINGFLKHKERHEERGNGFKFEPTNGNKVASAVTCGVGSRATDDYIKVGKWNDFKDENGNKKGFQEIEDDLCPTILARAREDSINFSVPSSETRRGRVGHGVSQTLDTACNQGIATRQLTKQQLEKLENLQVDENVAGCITNAIGRAGSSDEYIASVKRNAMITQRIRRLTPLECFRLMDFNENFKWNVSDSQAYKQAGNSIVVSCLVEIIKRLDLRQPK